MEMEREKQKTMLLGRMAIRKKQRSRMLARTRFSEDSKEINLLMKCKDNLDGEIWRFGRGHSENAVDGARCGAKTLVWHHCKSKVITTCANIKIIP